MVTLMFEAEFTPPSALCTKLQKGKQKQKRKSDRIRSRAGRDRACKFINLEPESKDLLVRIGECNQCGECCKTVNITAVRDVTLRQHKSKKELELYLSYRGISVVGEDVEANQLYYSIDIPCQQLGLESECKIRANLEAKLLLCHCYPMEPDGTEECSYEFQSSSPLGLKDFDIVRTREGC